MSASTGTESSGGGHLPPLQRHLSNPRTRQVLRLQNGVLRAAREFLADAGFVELQAPIIGPATDPGVRGARQVEVDYYGTPYKLMTSAILYKQASLLAFDKIFYVAPNVRLEPPEASSTERHLTEFHQIDIEMAGASKDDVMRLLESLLVHVVREVTEGLPDVFAALGREVAAFGPLLSEPFERVSHAQAKGRLQELGLDADLATEIDWAGERLLSTRADRPFFVVDYPTVSRGFYDREHAEEPGVLNNFDLLAGEGYGELVSGGEREFEYERIIDRMRQSGEDPEDYGWYLKMVREGIPDSAGFGIGLQRLVRYLAGLEAVWQASAYPKLPKVISP